MACEIIRPTKTRDSRFWVSNRTAPISAELIEKVELDLLPGVLWVPRMKDACWLYLGSISGNSGYGQIEYRLDKNVCCKMGVHVLMLRAATMRTIPLYHQANHLCEVRSCANPNHIYIGTQERNMNDMVARGCARDQGTLIMECSAQIHLRKAMGKPIPRYYQKMAKLFKFDHILEGASLEGE